MKYDARACHFNMDTGCVELLLRDGRMISINCTGVEDALDVTMAQRFELDYLIYWCCTIKVDIENSKGQYIEKDKQEATKDGSESTKIQHGI